MKTLTLNFKKWICGAGVSGSHSCTNKDSTAHGSGSTQLLNEQGYMCCLGQFSRQLNPKITRDDLLKKPNPDNIGIHVNLLNRKEKGNFYNTQLTSKAVDINDASNTTITEKIALLRKLFSKHGYKIKVTNLPKSLKK